MSKAHDPHWRYVAFRLHGEAPLSRRAVQNAVLGRARREGVPDDEAPQLTRYEWPHAIVRVHHFHLAAVREWLPRITWAVEAAARVPVTVETLSSSGTIRALTRRLGVLQERGQPPTREKVGGLNRSGGAGRMDGTGRTGGPTGPHGSTQPTPPARAPPARRAPPTDGPAPAPGRVPRRRQGSSVPPQGGG